MRVMHQVRALRKVAACLLLVTFLAVLLSGCSWNQRKSTELSEGVNPSPVEAWVCDVKGNREAAVTVCSDDGIYFSGLNLNEIAKKNGIRVTVAATVRNADKYLSGWQDIEKEGYVEIVNHSYTHMKMDDEESITKEQLRLELEYSKAFFERYFTTPQICYVTPNNVSVPKELERLGEVGYYACRSGSRGFNSTSPEWGIEKFQWMNLGTYGILDGGFDGQEARVNEAIKQHSWYIEMWHNVEYDAEGSPYQIISMEEGDSHLAYLKSLEEEGRIWVPTFTEATRYFQEKEHVVVSAVDMGDAFEVEIDYADDFLNPDIFNYPLTVLIDIPDNVAVYDAIANGDAIAYHEVNIEGNKCIMLDAPPQCKVVLHY